MKNPQEYEVKQAYFFDNVRRLNHTEDYALQICQRFSDELDKTIKGMEERLHELKELSQFIQHENPVHLLKNNNSGYEYIDAAGIKYSYYVVNNKPVLIDEQFRMFEIIEYENPAEVKQDKGNGSVCPSWVDKIVKIKMV